MNQIKCKKYYFCENKIKLKLLMSNRSQTRVSTIINDSFVIKFMCVNLLEQISMQHMINLIK